MVETLPMACCWEKLPALTPLLDTELELRDVKWWQHHDGTVVMNYYENTGVYASSVRQAAFLGGRPGFVGPVSIDEINTRGLNTPRQDMWAAITSALGNVLFHGPFLKREPVFSGGQFATVDFMRTIKTSTQGGTLECIFVLVPGLFYQPVHVGNDKLGGSSQASEFPAHGEFEVATLVKSAPGNEGKSIETLWRESTNKDDVLTAWAANENDKVAQNPSTTGFAAWRTETAEIYFEDIAAFGGHYGSITNFYRAFGGQRLQIVLDVDRPPHRDFRSAPDQSASLEDLVMDGFYARVPTYTPVIWADVTAWDTARGLNRIPGEPLPDLPSQAYMTSLAHVATQQVAMGTGPTVEGWFNENLQPDGGILYLWINGERMLYDHNRERDWVSFFTDRMRFINVQEYSPPSAFVDFQQQALPVGYADYKGSVEGGDVNTVLGPSRTEEIQDADE